MRTVYLIGNGFDLNLGLKTKYSNFYEWLLKQKTNEEPEVVLKFKKDISLRPKNWSDLELELGKFTSQIKKAEEANQLHDYLIEHLSEYLSEIENSWDINENEKRKLIEDLLNPTANNRILPSEAQRIESYQSRWQNTSPWITNIITFNYTQSIERVLNDNYSDIPLGTILGKPVKLETIEHIHGYTRERMILGVNDKSHLSNEYFHANQEFTDRYIKSDCNTAYGVDEEKKCIDKIKAADFICIYGMSYGITDKRWWDAIVEKLVGGVLVILFEYDEDAKFNQLQGVHIKHHKEKIKLKFLQNADLTLSEKEDLKTNIIVALNADIFKLEIMKN